MPSRDDHVSLKFKNLILFNETLGQTFVFVEDWGWNYAYFPISKRSIPRYIRNYGRHSFTILTTRGIPCLAEDGVGLRTLSLQY